MDAKISGLATMCTYNSVYFVGLIFTDWILIAKTAKIESLEYFLYKVWYTIKQNNFKTTFFCTSFIYANNASQALVANICTA